MASQQGGQSGINTRVLAQLSSPHRATYTKITREQVKECQSQRATQSVQAADTVGNREYSR